MKHAAWIVLLLLSVAAPALGRTPAPPAIVLDTRAGMATISVGSAKGVKMGMKLVVYRDKRFVGYLKIALVEEHLSGGYMVESVLVARRGDKVTSEDVVQRVSARVVTRAAPVVRPGSRSLTRLFARRGACNMAQAIADIRQVDFAVWGTKSPPRNMPLKSARKIGMDANDQPDVLITVHSAGKEGPEVLRFYGIAGKKLKPQVELISEYGQFEPLNWFGHQGRRLVIAWGHSVGSAGGGPQWVLCKSGPRVQIVPYDNPMDKTRHLLAKGERAASHCYLNPGTWGTTRTKQPDGLSFDYYIWGPGNVTSHPTSKITGTFSLKVDSRTGALRFVFKDARRQTLEGKDQAPPAPDGRPAPKATLHEGGK